MLNKLHYLILFSLSCCKVIGNEPCTENLLVLLRMHSVPYSGNIQAATRAAINAFRNMFNCSINIEFADNYGLPNKTVSLILNRIGRNESLASLSAIIGIDPGCSLCCVQANNLAKSLSILQPAQTVSNSIHFGNVPHFVSHGCVGSITDFKFDQMATSAASVSDLSQVLPLVMESFNWHSVALLMSQTILESADIQLVKQALNNFVTTSLSFTLPILTQPNFAANLSVAAYKIMRTLAQSVKSTAPSNFNLILLIILTNVIKLKINCCVS